mgnify:CR=1 FL=1
MKIRILLLTTLVFLISCASTVKPPKWYVNPPEYKKGVRYTAGTATADDLQSAFDMARLAAESDLGKELKSQINGAIDRERQIIKETRRNELNIEIKQRTSSPNSDDLNHREVYYT